MQLNLRSLKSLIGIISIFTGIISIIYFAATLSAGVTFAKFFGLLGAVLIIYGFVKICVSENFIIKKAGHFIKFMRLMIIILLISFITIEGFIISSGMRRSTASVDYIVILGAGLNGETPSLTLLGRLQDSLQYIKEHPDTKIILSGGKGPGESITEAEAMKRFYIKQGIDERLIIKEERSTNTAENLKFTNELLNKFDSRTHKSILIVTSNFHVFRAKLLAKRIGFMAYGYPAEIPNWLIPTYYIREYLAVVKSLIFDMNI